MINTTEIKKIIMIATGGTIASVETESGLAPGIGGGDLLDGVRARWKDISFEARDVMSVDSSNMQPEDQMTIARAAASALEEADAVIIAHGTDTMAYSAAALSYMLGSIESPVVFTGSQIPFGAPCSDAQDNIELAIAAARSKISGVSVAFGGRIIRGTRAVKVSSTQMTAFESVNAPLLAEMSACGLRVFDRGAREKIFSQNIALCSDVAIVKAHPGLDPKFFDAVVSCGARAIVVEAFGAGGVSALAPRDVSAKIGELSSSGVHIAVTTQCLRGGVDLSLYEVGHRLLDAGVISCGDMTTEAAFAKMMWALGSGIDPAEAFGQDYAGEITL